MLSILTAVAVSLAPVAHSRIAPEEPTFEARLELLVERLEQERQTGHIPGMSLVVVRGDEIVLAHGFGVANVETGDPVTPETIFAIGSTTKAFTATVVGMLVDDELMEFDSPITDFLPYFELPIESRDGADVTVRDLLCHRTGFTRMSMLWAGGKISRERILKTAIKAEPWTGFRQKFLYNNVQFLAAGVASGVAADTDWDTLVADRIFIPLGMQSTTTSVAEARKDPRLAFGYQWNKAEESYTHKTMRELATIAPAGAINSNALDMSRWLRFLIADGEFEGRRLISEESLAETRRPNVQVSGSIAYGMGWMVRQWNSEPLLEHGGNIDGFGAQVAYLPDSDLGYALLTNVTATPLQQGSIAIVFDTLLGELEEQEAEGDAEFLAEFLAEYSANFGPFHDQKFSVLVQNGHLSVDVPGQTIYELHAPDDEGKWYFRLTDAVAISFERDEEGEVIGMKMYQGGMSFDLPRVGVEVAAEIPLAKLERYLGEFSDPALGVDIEVVIQNNRLALNIPGQMVYELHAPDEEGRWFFRVTDEISAEFNPDEEQRIHSLTLNERGTSRELKRVQAENFEVLPSVSELMSMRGMDERSGIVQEFGSVRFSGKVRFAQSGVEGEYMQRATFDPPAYRLDMDCGEFGKITVCSNGERGWTFSSVAGKEELNGDLLAQLQMGHPSVMLGDWRETFESVHIKGLKRRSDREFLIVTLGRGALPSITAFVDAETGDLVRSETVTLHDIVSLPVRTSSSDFREVHGYRLPFMNTESNDSTGHAIFTMEEVEVGLEFPAGTFELE